MRAQDQPLAVAGTFSTGYYSATTKTDTNQTLRFVPFGAKFDADGYLLTPDLVNFTVQPELNVGPQASEAGFQGGNGVRLRITFLRRIFPVTFHYANVQVDDVYFGGLTQLSGYTLKERNKELGLTAELKYKSLPEIIVDWGTGSVDSTSGIEGIPDYLSSGRHVNVDGRYGLGGWEFDGFFHYQYERSDLLAPSNNGTEYGSLQQTVTEYQGSVRRGFWKDSELFAEGGSQTTSSMLFTLPIDLTTRYASVNLRMFQRRRWRGSLKAGYSSNLASQLLAQAVSSLQTAGSVAPDASILAPFSHAISDYLVHGSTDVTLGGGFGLYSSAEWSALASDNAEAALSSRYYTTSAGLTYAKKFGWGSVSGEYEREYGAGSVTGLSGTIQGQNYRASFQHASANGMQYDFDVHGNGQSVHNAQPISENSFSVEGNIGRRVIGELSAHVGGGWQWSDIVNSANQFRTDGYIARASIDHPRVQISGSINNTASNSLPFYNQLLTGLAEDAILIAPSQPVLSNYMATVFSIHSNPIRKVEFSAQWTRSRQHLAGILANDFELLNVFLTYHFRRLQLEAGYIRAIQTFSIYPYTARERFYVRVSRRAKIL